MILAALAALALSAALRRTVAGCVVAAALMLPAALRVLLTGSAVTLAWEHPLLGKQALVLDPLSAWFMLPLFVVAIACAVYGRAHELRAFNLLVLAIATLLLAGDAVLFLAAWEVMTICAYLLVTHEHERAEVRRAGLLYLILTHAGTACLLAMFASLGALRFADVPTPRSPVALFSLALIGFGCKAGAWPLHVWLPEAHPIAPSHVSALLSGVVIKTGIYGLLRVTTLLGPLPMACGATLLALGAASALLGVLSALAQHELKRLLAYHSIENIGIILMGAGLGLMALSAHRPAIAAIAFAGALLHTLNHALFKSLLFLAAGAVGKACGTLQLDKLGGLARRMPRTAIAFVIGAAAISGLPPLNGFVSELLVYLALLKAGSALPFAAEAEAALAFAVLACVGGLALACFAKAAGTVFLGTPRTSYEAHEAGSGMVAPMLALAALCALLGLAGPLLATALERPVLQLAGASLGAAVPALNMSALIGAVFAGVIALLAALRAALVRHPAASGTWACGFPNASAQYTAASFAQPLVSVFRAALLPRRHETRATGAFPRALALEEHTPQLLWPSLRHAAAALAFARKAQPSRVQSYVLAIFATLLLLLWWRLG